MKKPPCASYTVHTTMSMTPSRVKKKILDSYSDPTFSKFFGSYSHWNFLNLYSYNSDSDSSYLKTFDSDSVKSKKQLRFRLLPKVRLRLQILAHNPVANTSYTTYTLPIHCLYTAYTLPTLPTLPIHCPHYLYTASHYL